MTKILLAEDDNDMRRFLAKALERAGYEVVAFDNGGSAYERLREEPFSLLLTDIVMPEMDGIELARRATELDPKNMDASEQLATFYQASGRLEEALQTYERALEQQPNEPRLHHFIAVLYELGGRVDDAIVK